MTVLPLVDFSQFHLKLEICEEIADEFEFGFVFDFSEITSNGLAPVIGTVVAHVGGVMDIIGVGVTVEGRRVQGR